MRCTGNASENCGGGYILSIYKIGKIQVISRIDCQTHMLLIDEIAGDQFFDVVTKTFTGIMCSILTHDKKNNFIRKIL